MDSLLLLAGMQDATLARHQQNSKIFLGAQGSQLLNRLVASHERLHRHLIRSARIRVDISIIIIIIIIIKSSNSQILKFSKSSSSFSFTSSSQGSYLNTSTNHQTSTSTNFLPHSTPATAETEAGREDEEDVLFRRNGNPDKFQSRAPKFLVTFQMYQKIETNNSF